MLISIISIFPGIFQDIFSYSIIRRAQEKNLVRFHYYDLRKFTTDAYQSVDDRPYGGGKGMIMRIDILHRAIEHVRNKSKVTPHTVLLDPKGSQYSQSKAKKFARLDHLLLICGHYEGVDDRITHFIDEKISIGRYILTGGEIPAMVITDSVVRLVRGVLPEESTSEESFSRKNNREYPQFTRPRDYLGFEVPTVLISGNHKKISRWKKEHEK